MVSTRTGCAWPGVDISNSADLLDMMDGWSILPDVNALFYAFRKDALLHSLYWPWLKSVKEGTEPFAISPQVRLQSFAS